MGPMRDAAAILCLLSLWGCDTAEPFELPDRVQEVTVGELRADPSLDGQDVLIRSAVVLAHDTFDESGAGRVGTVYIADPGNDADHALQTFAPRIQIPVGDVLSPGNIIDVRGTYVRFTGPGCPPDNCFMDRVLPQLGIGAVIDRVGFWRDPPPVELTVAEYLADPGRYVGNLITVRDLTANAGYTMSGDGTRVNPFDTAEGVRVGGELYMIPDVGAGTRIARLTGIASYFFDDFVLPRGPGDVEVLPP